MLSAGDALYALRRSVNDPENVLQSWDPTLVDPCTWFHVTCDPHNRVTRLLVYTFFFFFIIIFTFFMFYSFDNLFIFIFIFLWGSDLGNAKLSGKLVPELGKLERLQYL